MRTRRHAIAPRIIKTMGVASAIVLLMATSAWAIHAYIEISVPIDTIVRDVPEGSVVSLATAEVPAEFIGHACEVRAHAENQISRHRGNDLVVASGDSQVVLPDVEAQPGQIVEAEDSLELGDVITVSLIMGPDEVFSAGIDVIVECFAEDTTTTTEATTTTQQSDETTTTAETSTTQQIDETTTTAETTTSVTVSPSGESTSTVAVLPFTGPEGSQLGLLGLALLAAGALVLAGLRRTE